MIDSTLSLGVLVAERPSRAEVFERLRLDYCCSGGQTLAQACERHGLDVDTVCRMLEALEHRPPDRWRLECGDWRRASLAELCDHIVSAHHDKLRAELPGIDELLATVVRVHGAQHPELRDLQRLFGTMRHELESHIETEERVVFPICRRAEADHAPVTTGCSPCTSRSTRRPVTRSSRCASWHTTTTLPRRVPGVLARGGPRALPRGGGDPASRLRQAR